MPWLAGIEVASHIRWNVSIHGRMRETITIQVQWSTAQAARKEVLKTILSAHVNLQNYVFRITLPHDFDTLKLNQQRYRLNLADVSAQGGNAFEVSRQKK